MAHVDTSLPARPTGAAAKLADAHAEEHPLKLYGGWFCPFVQRSWIVLEEKKIPYEYREINPYKKEAEFLALNPRGLVPTLAVPKADAGSKHQKPLYESSVICEYLNDEYADESKHGPDLFPPGSAYERARCRLWIDHISGKIVPGFYKFIQHTPEKDYTIEEARSNFLGHIKTLVREMLENSEDDGPWFLGGRFSMVDVMLAPWAKRMFLLDHYKPGGVAIPAEGQGGEDEALWGRWRQWYSAIADRQSVKDTWSDDGYYVQAYKRYAEDTTNSEVAQATRKGVALP
ncbi:Glutathione S-transferase omega-1 [Apiospora marii]|uniref:Glutathione S-transferase omega-1 n=1 Tax=Apiospora marii TaxID=335849 RepID=A0ABR1R788_9PEZI